VLLRPWPTAALGTLNILLKKAALQAAESGPAAYTAYRGGPDVRGRCAEAISALLSVDIDAERNLVLTTGTQGGLFAVLSALVDAGDRVALTDPEYLFAERILRFLGAEVIRIPLDASGPGVDLRQLEDAAVGDRHRLAEHHHIPVRIFSFPAAVRAVRPSFPGPRPAASTRPATGTATMPARPRSSRAASSAQAGVTSGNVTG
jgi:hypothetical protein